MTRRVQELPRLTGALRAFGDVSQDFGNEVGLPLGKALSGKRKKRIGVQEQDWPTLTQQLLNRCSKADANEVNGKLRELMEVAKSIVGDDSTQEAIELAAVFLFGLFKDSTGVTRDEADKLRKSLGPYPASATTKAYSIVKKLTTLSPPINATPKSSAIEEQSTLKKEFGHNIHFNNPSVHYSADKICKDEEHCNDSLSEDETSNETPFSVDNFLIGMMNGGGNDKLVVGRGGGVGMVQEYDDPAASIKYNVSELLEMVGELIVDQVLQLLLSEKDDNSLQNELAEVIGFDRLELVQLLLQHRTAIVVSFMGDSETGESGPQSYKQKRAKMKMGTHRTGKPPTKQPAYGCQVTIVSEQERQLQRMFHKEDKKMMRREKGGKHLQDDIDKETYLASKGFIPETMRQEREQILFEASQQPLMGRHPVATTSRIELPYVFDAMAVAQNTSAFIAGAKVGIPVGAEKINTKTTEEVSLPPSAPHKPIVAEKIRISQLDNVAKLVFATTKRLNEIQSVVFETAYHTNENLLISAPTGAGKTNVAMLTVIREIKQHMVQDTIKKNEFKIIYVAPMKALAAEVVQKFSRQLQCLGISVRELTGDMQLTKREIENTQMIVTTPEKWDVVTRKGTGDVGLSQLVRLLIIDEVHLLHEDRGAVIESLVARTLRQVESTQNMIRIVGLSATLPNYMDVASFLRVNWYKGLFMFDGRFRPVPLTQTFIGVKKPFGFLQQLRDMEEACYDKVLKNVKDGHQVMVFVHARNATVKTAMSLRELATNYGDLSYFQSEQSPRLGQAEKQVRASANKQLRDLFSDGFSIHHAGMLRTDRSMVERLFSEGLIKVLVSTATLAWGVNLPAHAVVIKGTQLYDAKKGSFVDLGILDVLQIFGRAGRPQFDTHGDAYIITTHDKLSHYLALMTRQMPIESQFISSLTDNLNAEIALGTVTNTDEAIQWLNYTYLIVRMRKNPIVYGMSYNELEFDPDLTKKRYKLIHDAAEKLDKAHMIRYVQNTKPATFHSTDLGRIASHFYINYSTIETINEFFKPSMTEADVLSMVAKSQEFEAIKVREDEISELGEHLDNCCLPVPGGIENSYGKVNILIQLFISRMFVESFSLVSDQAYCAQNSARIIRALFEMAIRKNWSLMASRLLTLSKCVDRRLWHYDHPLNQFPILRMETVNKLAGLRMTMERLREMSASEIGGLLRHPSMGERVHRCVNSFPTVLLSATIQPITRTVLRVNLTVTPAFEWDDRLHGNVAEGWWVWLEDPDSSHIYHSEFFMLHKKHVKAEEPQHLVFTIPIFEQQLPPQYYAKAVSDRWLGAETVEPISFKHLILPELHAPHTNLLNLRPLPTSALKDKKLEELYRFPYFNPVQTQIFHTLYHSDNNVLLGAPTGSGKTVAAELAMFRVFREYPGKKSVYIAPLKALVRERIADWKIRFEQKLGKKVIELTGDVSPDTRAIAGADVIVTTPEKWDGISRSWQNRSYVRSVALLVIDEIHLLGDERGPVLEVIVSRTNFISSHTERKVRIVGLSTALANAKDLADWLGISQGGLFNFRPVVRPVPLEVHINGFPGKHYCPRMATMNKPLFQAICTHSPLKPTLVFVSSRRQTRLTAMDLITFLATHDNPKQWLHMPERELEQLTSRVTDSNLKFTLAFGIAIHHAGLREYDRKVVEELFVETKIQVLVATSTLAWGVNFPAHLVVVKGTEYYDGATKQYVDYPITDVLQMMGRAGRPQFDSQGVAVIFVHDVKKHFYKKFLYEPFPVESNLLAVISDHLNAEIVAGTIASIQDAMEYITWTYFFRRLLRNPSYYNLEAISDESINKFLSKIVEKIISDLSQSYCLMVDEDGHGLSSLLCGCVASYYYLHHTTVRMFNERLTSTSNVEDLMAILSDSAEYKDLPVRHNEDLMNKSLAESLPIGISPDSFDSPHTKTHLLLQAHFSSAPLPVADYVTDTKSVLDQSLRILQAMIDVSANEGWLATVLHTTVLVQMVVQGCWYYNSDLSCLPHMTADHHSQLDAAVVRSSKKENYGVNRVECLPELMAVCACETKFIEYTLKRSLTAQQIKEVTDAVKRFPMVSLCWTIEWEDHMISQPLSAKGVNGTRLDEKLWMKIPLAMECIIKVELARINHFKGQDHKAFTPRFPKPKDEGWWLILGVADTGELVALKRLGQLKSRTFCSLAFTTSHLPERRIYTVYLISDCYFGIDQQYDVHIETISKQ